jgi:hypothetical protein
MRAPTGLAEPPAGKNAPELRLNAVCPYYTMYPLSFPLDELKSAQPGEAVLDPFCGRGTTLFAARLRGLEAVGIDLNPVAVAIARAKLASTTVGRVKNLADELISSHQDAETPTGQFWTLAFDSKTLQDICALRTGLMTAGEGHTAALLRAVFLGALHGPRNKGEPSYLSNQMPRSYATKPAPAVRFWEKHELLPTAINVSDVLGRRLDRLFAASPPAPVGGRVIEGDARTALSGTRRRFSRVITSPPYLGMRTYLPDQWLRNWALGGEPTPEYALPGQISSQRPETFAEELADAWNAISERCLPGAQMTVRFGALPSIPIDPSDLITDSLRRCKASWQVVEVRSAGGAHNGRRQADQFVSESSSPITEKDIRAVLDA